MIIGSMDWRLAAADYGMWRTFTADWEALNRYKVHVRNNMYPLPVRTYHLDPSFGWLLLDQVQRTRRVVTDLPDTYRVPAFNPEEMLY